MGLPQLEVNPNSPASASVPFLLQQELGIAFLKAAVFHAKQTPGADACVGVQVELNDGSVPVGDGGLTWCHLLELPNPRWCQRVSRPHRVSLKPRDVVLVSRVELSAPTGWLTGSMVGRLAQLVLGLTFFVTTAPAISSQPIFLPLLDAAVLVFLVLMLRHQSNGKTKEIYEPDQGELGDAD